jgi:hypothetical protein
VKTTKLHQYRLRAAAFRRGLMINPECQRLLRGRSISAGTLIMLAHHFDNQPPSFERSRIVSAIRILQWLALQIEARLRLRVVASRSTMAKAFDDANAWVQDAALDEFIRLLNVMAGVINDDPIPDPIATARDLLMLQMIVDEFDRLEESQVKNESGSFRDALTNGATDSSAHRAIMRAITKAGDDRARAIKNVCRLHGVKSLDALPAHIKSVVRAALPQE